MTTDTYTFILSLAGTVFGGLLGIIAYFLQRLVKQFDVLNATVIKIDKDLSQDITRLSEQNKTLKSEVADLDPLWDRMRAVEGAVIELKSGMHCPAPLKQ